jgi:hypothetical protein
VPLVIMMVWMGVYTQTFLPAVTEANMKILNQTSRTAHLVLPAGGPTHAR